MRCSPNSERHFDIDVFLNGEQVKRAFYADDVKGEVWAAYCDARGRVVSEIDAEPGALFFQGVQAVRLTGKVEIRVHLKEGEDEAEVRKLIDETSGRIKVYQWVG